VAHAERRPSGKWRARWDTGELTESGRAHIGNEDGFTSYDAALKYARARETEVVIALEVARREEELQRRAAAIAGMALPDPQMALTLVGELWGRVLPTLDRAPNTIIAYRRAYDQFVGRRWGEDPLGSVLRLDVDAWRAQLRRDGCGESQMVIIFAVMRLIFDAAVDNDMLRKSPIAPRGGRRARPGAVTSREGVVVPPEALRQVLARLPSFADQLMAVVKLVCGMRFSEVAAVRRGCLALAGAAGEWPASGDYYLHPRVGAVLEDEHGVRYFGPPKSGGGRVWDLPPFLAELLLAYLGVLPADQELLFVNTVGDPWQADTWRNLYWRPACDGVPAHFSAGGQVAHPALPPVWPGLVPHDLKHTCKAIMGDGGVHPTLINYVLGHRDGSGAPSVYAHATPRMRAHRIAVLEQWWSQLDWDDWKDLEPRRRRARRRDSVATPISPPKLSRAHVLTEIRKAKYQLMGGMLALES
jgi:integrase